MRIQRISLPKYKMMEINEFARTSDPRQIIQGDGYLYFLIQNTQEDVSLKALIRATNINCYAVLNFRNSIIGYIVKYNRKPFINAVGLGAAVFYSKAKKYRKPTKVLFADSKFRLLSQDGKDFFASVKWKSNNPTE